MRDLNPERFKEPKSYNANCYEDRMGFALRDEQTTKSTTSSTVINPMGADISDAMRKGQTGDLDDFLAYRNSAPIIIPGVMSFDFEPVFAPQSGERKQIVEDIFNNLWSVYRIYYNGADSIQPADIAIRSFCQMLIDTYVQIIRRALDVIRLCYSANNSYIRNTVILEALGFSTAGKDDMYWRMNYTGWVNYFNQQILGALNACQWIGGIFPGEHRWSSLCTEIYKDESIDSDYVQLYLFKMRSFYNLVTEEVEPGIYAWKLVREDFPTDFATFLTKVHDFIRDVYYDSSALDIQAMLQTIKVRGQGRDIEHHIYKLQYDEYPLDGRTLKLTYDWNMLLAIHNSTTMFGLRAFDVTQDPATGRVTQYFAFDQSAYSYKFFRTPKIINLPCFGASQQDFINATQWVITGTEDDIIPGTGINPEVLGTDVLVDTRIWNYDYIHNAITNTPNYQCYRMNITTFGGSSPEGRMFGSLQVFDSLAGSSQFTLAPIGYLCVDAEDDDYQGIPENTVYKFIAPLEVVYKADSTKIADMKAAFVRNFWGYPIRVAHEGKFDLQNKVTSTDASIGVGEAANKITPEG